MKRALSAVLLAIVAASPAPVAAADYRRVGVVLGARQAYTIRADDSLFEVARRYGLGYTEIAAANPGVDPFVPDPGRRVVIPTEWILPDAPIRRGIIVNIAEMRLFVLRPKRARTVATFPIGVGDEGTETPVGKYSIVEKLKDPAWNVPRSIRKKQPDLPAVVPPGPDNPLGSRALRLSDRTLLIHGTNRPWGIGMRSTRGCIRLYEEDIARLFDMVDGGTPVAVVDQPVKIAADGRRVLLQVHDSGDGRDLFKEALALLDAKGLADHVDPGSVRKAATERSGLVVDVAKR